jgi:hypothetical protein
MLLTRFNMSTICHVSKNVSDDWLIMLRATVTSLNEAN